jgi:hypothetical protein
MADSRKCGKAVILAEKRDLFTARAWRCRFGNAPFEATYLRVQQILGVDRE